MFVVVVVVGVLGVFVVVAVLSVLIVDGCSVVLLSEPYALLLGVVVVSVCGVFESVVVAVGASPKPNNWLSSKTLKGKNPRLPDLQSIFS